MENRTAIGGVFIHEGEGGTGYFCYYVEAPANGPDQGGFTHSHLAVKGQNTLITCRLDNIDSYPVEVVETLCVENQFFHTLITSAEAQ